MKLHTRWFTLEFLLNRWRGGSYVGKRRRVSLNAEIRWSLAWDRPMRRTKAKPPPPPTPPFRLYRFSMSEPGDMGFPCVLAQGRTAMEAGDAVVALLRELKRIPPEAQGGDDDCGCDCRGCDDCERDVDEVPGHTVSWTFIGEEPKRKGRKGAKP